MAATLIVAANPAAPAPMLDLFFIRDGVPTALLLQGSYRFDLLALSVLVAVLSSIMALQVAGMARLAHSTLLRQTAFLTGSFSLGVTTTG